MATISVLATISALKTVTNMASGDVAIVRGYYGDADGGSGEFAYQDTAPIAAKVNMVTGSSISPITITTKEPNIFQTGGQVQISGVAGLPDGTFTITVTADNQFTLDGSTGAGTYSGGDIAYADQGTTIFPSSGSGQWKRICTDYISVKHFGAKGKATNDTNAVVAAINAVGQAGGGYVDFPPGHYMLDGQLVLPSGVTLRGAGRDSTILDFAPYPSESEAAISSKGTLGGVQLLAADAPKGATTLRVMEHGRSAGDRIILGSYDLFYGMPPSLAPDNPDIHPGPKGEQCIVYSVLDRNTITLLSPTMDFYTTAQGAQIQLVAPVVSVGVRDMTVLRANQDVNASFGLWFENAERVRVENVLVQYATYTGIELLSVLDAVVSNCSILDTFLLKLGTSYGIEIGNASQDVRVAGCYLRRFRHGVSIGKNANFGVPRRIDIVGNCFDKTNEADLIAGAVDIGHFMTQFVSFVSNVVVAPQSVPALSLDGFDHLISSNLLIGGGIQLGTSNDAFALASKKSAVDAYSRIAILANKIRALPGSISPGIYLETSGNTVIGNDIDLTGSVGGNAVGVTVMVQNAVRTIADNVISNNKVTNPSGAAGISVYGSTRTSIVGNQVELNPASIVNQNPVFFYLQLRDLKAQFNTHVVKTKVHTNFFVHSSPDIWDVVFANVPGGDRSPTDEGSSINVVNELCVAYAKHIKKDLNHPGGPIHEIADTTNTLEITKNATDLPSAYAIFVELQLLYNKHVANVGGNWHSMADTADRTTLAVQLAPTYGIYVEDHGTTPCSSVDVDENRISDPSGMSILVGIKFNTLNGTDCSYGRNAFTLARSGSTEISAPATMLSPRHEGQTIP